MPDGDSANFARRKCIFPNSIVYGVDKWNAKQGKWRISETTLLMLAAVGGAIGALLGMQVWHHKTKHCGRWNYARAR